MFKQLLAIEEGGLASLVAMWRKHKRGDLVMPVGRVPVRRYSLIVGVLICWLLAVVDVHAQVQPAQSTIVVSDGPAGLATGYATNLVDDGVEVHGRVRAGGLQSYAQIEFSSSPAGVLVGPGLCFVWPQGDFNSYTCRVRSNTTGTYKLRARVAGTADIPANWFGADTPNGVEQDITFVDPPPVSARNSLLVMSDGERLADGIAAHTATVTARRTDGGVVVAGVPVQFVITKPVEGLTISECTTNVRGICSVKIVSLHAGQVGVIARINGEAINRASQNVLFSSTAPRFGSGSFEVSPGPKYGNGVDAYDVAVSVLDTDGQPLAGATVVPRLSPQESISATPEICITGPDGTCGFSVAADPGMFALQVYAWTDMHQSIGATSLYFGIPPEAANSTLSIDASGTRIADGVAFRTATATVRDRNGYANRNAVVNFSSPDYGVTFSANSCTTPGNDDSGFCTVEIRSTMPGAITVNAHLAMDNAAIGGSPGMAQFVAGAALASASTLAVSPGNRAADGRTTHTISVTAHDALGSIVPDAVVAFTADPNATLGANTCTTGANGACVNTVTSTVSGTHQIHAWIGGEEIEGSPAGATFVAGQTAASTSTLELSNDNRIADGLEFHTATVTARDAKGNLVLKGQKFDFTVGAGATIASNCTTDANGTCQVEIKATTAGSYVVNARIGAADIANSPSSVTFVASAVTTTTSHLSVSTGNKTAGVETHTATVTALNANNNPVANTVVDFTVTAGAALDASSCTTDANGVCSVTISVDAHPELTQLRG